MVYVCSDIHGLWDRYEKAINMLTKDDTMYILGDVIDRAEFGIKIIKDIMARDNVHLLIGNHEHMMLKSLRECNEKEKQVWHVPANSGGITEFMFLNENKDTQDKILEFLYNSYLTKILNVNGRDYLLTHSAPPHILEDLKYCNATDAERFFITWHSPFRADLYVSRELYPHNYTVIIGHVPVQKLGTDKIYSIGHITDIDCGCGYAHLWDNSSLAVLRLNDWNVTYI